MPLGTLIVFVIALASSSYLVGVLPLWVSLSKKQLAQISAIGTGLLLGAAMGVIIPEGIETIVESHNAAHTGSQTNLTPSTKIALSLLSGFTLMFVMEQLLTPYLASRGRPSAPKYALAPSGSSENGLAHTHGSSHSRDIDLELEMELNAMGINDTHLGSENGKKNPNMLTLGLVIHSLADGLALGAANAVASDSHHHHARSETSPDVAEPSWWRLETSGVSLVVFLAIIIHKAPTALALTSTLLPQLPARRVKQHLIAFSLSSPTAALTSYFVLALLGGSDQVGKMTGIALMFSGGTFLYVATVLSALPAHSHGGDSSYSEASPSDLSAKSRTGLVVFGMFVPVFLSGLFGHGH